MPTFDFGHINCITKGGLTCKENYLEIFKYCIEKLGFERTKNCHIHFSKIEYGEKGEIRHLNYDDMIYDDSNCFHQRKHLQQIQQFKQHQQMEMN